MEEKNKSELVEFLKTFAIVLVIAVALRLFVIDITRVSGDSMLNTLETDDILLVDKLSPHFSPYNRGEVVIVHPPDNPNILYVKRVVGLPKERVELKDGSFYINGEKISENYTNEEYTYPDVLADETYWQLGEDEYFVVGDNRILGVSNDSRNFGPVNVDNFVGKAKLRVYPFDKINKLGFKTGINIESPVFL